MTMDEKDTTALRITYERLQEKTYADFLRLELMAWADTLATCYESDSQDEMSVVLNHGSSVLYRCQKALPEGDNCLYEIGRLEGLLDGFGLLYEHRMEQARTDAEIEQQLSNSRGTTLRILQALYESGDEEMTHEQLAKAVGVTKQNLSNIMRRLEPTMVFRAYSTSARKYYSLTDAGVRYYEKKSKQESGSSNEFAAILTKLEKRIGDVETLKERNAQLTAEVEFYKKRAEDKEKELKDYRKKLEELQEDLGKVQIAYTLESIKKSGRFAEHADNDNNNLWGVRSIDRKSSALSSNAMKSAIGG